MSTVCTDERHGPVQACCEACCGHGRPTIGDRVRFLATVGKRQVHFKGTVRGVRSDGRLVIARHASFSAFFVEPENVAALSEEER